MPEELVDIINDAGETIRVEPRSVMRRERLPHRCVYILMFSTRGEIFVHQRTATKDIYPSYWDLAAGGVLSSGETFDEGAARECQEELGVATPLTYLFPFNFADERTIVQARVYRGEHDGPFRLQPEEVVQGEFVASDMLAKLIDTRPFCPDGLQVWQRYKQV
ncbi:MAG: NUDIX domain-containing protein [Planctomycetia bacterium]|nr:NUDIX domain-containing protein [Planctomycetia bacterium]